MSVCVGGGCWCGCECVCVCVWRVMSECMGVGESERGCGSKWRNMRVLGSTQVAAS